MCKISKFFKSLFGFKPSDPKRRGWTLFKSSHKQHNHDEAISADQGSVQSRPPSVVAKLMGLDALPDSATTNQKQEMGMTPISPPFYAKSTFLLREDESHDGIYMEDSPWPVKHMQKTLKDDSIQVIKEQCEMPDDVFPNTLSFGVSSEINHKKLQNIEHLVQKLTRLNSTHDEAHTDYIASLCENTKPDDRYILEILLASGILLRDLGSSLTTFQFHSSGHPINPELFLVLEQTKFSNLPKQEPSNKKLLNKETIHRKLIFDTVNEVLAKKLALVVPSLESFSSKATTSEEKKDRCGVEHEVGWVDKPFYGRKVLNHEESWTDYDSKLHVIALDVESLFSDLWPSECLSLGQYRKDSEERRMLLWKGELLFVGRNSLLATVLFYRIGLSVQIAGDISGSTDIVKNQIAYCLLFPLIISLISNALSASPDTISILSHDASFSHYFQETVMAIGNDQLIDCMALDLHGQFT
ncbi:longifolia 1-like protein [Tanacetum coccineum]